MHHFPLILPLPLADCIERPRQSRDKRERKKRGSPQEADMSNQELELMAHLMRRAGFGATRDELEEYVAKGYETVVEELLHPTDPQHMPDDIIRRSHTEQAEMRLLDGAGANWLYRMITTRCPLEEKVALFRHGLFAPGHVNI